jgi:glutaconyl-CoA/methylmalonyl-CoA decarboxylase subunit gamma
VVVLDGERREVEVDLPRQTVRVGAREWPVHVVRFDGGSVSFEILGEVLDVRGELLQDGKPAGPITVNGELHTVTIESRRGYGTGSSPSAAGLVLSPGAPAGDTENGDGPGRPVLPPMPGKVLEVRVQNGEKVSVGQVLLVVEAMKMRNEVTSPIAGEVSGLRVRPGANVAAREVLLRVVAP